MALALLTRADDQLAAEWADDAPVAYGYEVLLVCDTSGDSPALHGRFSARPWTWSARGATRKTRWT